MCQLLDDHRSGVVSKGNAAEHGVYMGPNLGPI